MRNRILFLFFFCAAVIATADAKNYYVSAAGNNSNTGLTPATAWQTIAKVNSAFPTMAAGDSIFFRRGDTFFGCLIVGKSGTAAQPIVISAYGTGAKPVITGFITVTSWTQVSTGIYQANVPGAKAALNLVTLNNIPQSLGRYPNADDANGGYLNYESFTGATSITDNQLTSATNWTGAEVVVRKKLWVLDRGKITAHNSTTINFTNTNGSTYDGTNGYGYFFQNDPRTLDKQGEWYFNASTKNLQMYFGNNTPSSYSVKASGLDTLCFISSKNYISISNIVFEGTNDVAILGLNSGNITIKDCDFVNAGDGAINMQSVSSLLIDNCTTNYMLSNAIYVYNSRVTGVTIRNCAVKNTGTLPGMGQSNGNSYKAIYANVTSNLLIEYNRIDTTGYVALEFQGSNVTVRNNVVNYFDFIKDDAGGIYSYASGTDANPGPTYTNRVVRDNIVMNGIGAPYGRSSSTLFVSGIYMDGRTMNVDILNNTVFNMGKNGIHCNNPNGVNIKGNTSYNNLNAMSVMRWSWGDITNLTVKNNIFYPKTEAQRCFYYTNSGLNEPVANTVESALQELGTIDSNYYSMVNQVGFQQEVYATTGGALVATSPLSLEAWRANALHDQQGKKPAKLPISYKLNSLIGTNKFTNGLFSSNITGLTVFGTSVAGAWDNTGKISGGSLKLTFTSPVANKYILVHAPIGAVSSAKKYVFRFTTYGTTQQGIVRAYIRKTTSPYTTLSNVQVRSFPSGRKDHEILFNAPTTDAGGSFVIEVEQNSGTTYIDNVEFYEADATVYDTDAQWRFEYNDTKLVKNIVLDGLYTAIDGTTYNTTLTLQPFTSVILVKDTSNRPPLVASATATSINCYGDYSTVTVTATGGIAPYTGTGSFQVKAGTFTFTVTDATGATDTVSITIGQPAEALTATSTAGTITVAGGSTTVTVTAAGGTAPYTGTGTFTVTAGTYTYTVTDSKGCTTTTTITVYDGNGALVATADQSTVSIPCWGGTANVTVSASGGRAPYTGVGAYQVSAGRGSVKLSFPTSVTGTYTAMYYTIGAVSSSKNYVLRFSTVGTTANGKLRVALRQTFTPWATFTARQTGTFGTARKDFEFVFIAPTTQTAASFMIEIEQASGTTYIDNIAFFESSTTGVASGANLYTFGQFERNITNLYFYSANGNHTAVWDSTAKITSTFYYTVTDALGASSVVKVNTSQPAAALKATATAPAIAATGGTTTVTVTATGGTAPYTGTGSFVVSAGTYTYTIRDANGCSSSVTVTASVGNAAGARYAAGSTTNRLATENTQFKVMAWPNPSTSSFNLLAEAAGNEKVNVVVYSFDGRIVYQSAGITNSRMNFGSNFAAGVYTVKVFRGTESQAVKVIKSNQ